jgi:hypothetical protein
MRMGAMALALLAAAGTASAATDPAGWVKRILAEYDSIQIKQGWAPEGEARPGALASGKEARLVFALAPGSYRFVVLCESACGAGKVELLDSAGARIGGPGVLVEMPKIDAAPAAAETYTLRVAMTDCASAECAWSARLYAKK